MTVNFKTLRLAILSGLLAHTALGAELNSATSTSFQGVLNGPNGQPLANGSYNLTFRFYTNAATAVALGVTNVSNVPVSGGVASTAIPVEPVWFDGQTRYLGISVNGGTELAPRVMVTAVPYAVKAVAAEALTAPDSAQFAVSVATNGFVGIGTSTPQRSLYVQAPYRRPNAFAGLALDGHDDASDSTRNVTGLMFYRDHLEQGGIFWNNDDTLRILAQVENRSDGIILNRAGSVGLGPIAAGVRLNVDGTTRTRVLQITGGSDLAEPFDVTTPSEKIEVVRGMVMVIDRERDGKLTPCARAYDTAVAGVLSGANGLQPGMVMQAEGHSHAAGEHPLSMTGRVWCLADAAHGPIQRGDRLTTSPTVGHAMRAAEQERAPGAVIGKAMSELREGQGFVLVLVNLQ